MDRQTKLDVLQKELSRKHNKKINICPICKDRVSRVYIGDSYSGYETRECNNCGVLNYDNGEIIGDNKSYKIEILGHKVILSDVLVWLGKNKYSARIDTMGYIMISKLGNMFTIYRDLTKPYLSEQSDEVISEIYEVFLSLYQPLLTKKD